MRGRVGDCGSGGCAGGLLVGHMRRQCTAAVPDSDRPCQIHIVGFLVLHHEHSSV